MDYPHERNAKRIPMPDTRVTRETMTLADHEVFVAGRPEEERWELIGGVVEMMTNPYLNHGLIVGNIVAPLTLALADGNWRAVAGGLRVQRSDDRGEDFAAMPDLVVICGERPNRTFTTEAVVIVEVLSRSTMDRDRGPKLAFYKTLPTARHIVFVYQGQMRVEHYRRSDEGWLLTVLNRPSERFELDSIGVALALEAIYLDVPVLRPIDAADVGEDEPPSPIS